MDNVSNAAFSDKYKEAREKIEQSFNEYTPLREQEKEYLSPSGKYLLCVTPYKTKEGCWNYTKGIIYNNTTGEEIFTIFRNYSSFWHKWIDHQNGNEYLLCGEDYQGYVCLNMTENKKHVYFHENGFKGWGFCWIEVRDYDKEYDTTITVEGCYWGAEYELVEFDFSKPDNLPYPEISRRLSDCYDEVVEEDNDEDDEKESPYEV